MNVIERSYDISFSYFAPLTKAYEKDGEMFIVVKASDTSVDRDNEKIAPELIDKMKKLAKEGKLVLLDHHKATFPMGRSVDYEENSNDPLGFYPVFKLDPEHPYSRYLFKVMKENIADFGVSIGGRFPKMRWASTSDGRIVAEVYDAEIDHVAFVRRGYEANPNTGIVRAVLKAMKEVGMFEKEMDWISQATQVRVVPPKDDEEGKDEEEKRCKRKDEFKVSKEFIDEAVNAVINSLNPSISDEQFAKEFQLAISEAKIINPNTDKVISAREREFGYERGVYACANPPRVWSNIAEFADPVGYLYPITPNYIKASLNHFLKVGYNYYLPESAAKVYASLIEAALKNGVPVSYTLNPLLSAALPTDLKTKLPDYSPSTDVMCSTLWNIYKEQAIKELVGEDEPFAKATTEELREALRERERKYGYKAPLNANLTKPKRWEDVPDDEFADPVGYKYPVHTPKNARAALSYFNKPKNRASYTVEGQIKVLERIIQACLRHGIKVQFQPEDPLYWLLPKSLKRKLEGYDEHEDMDTEERQREMREKVERMAAEDVEKCVRGMIEWAKEGVGVARLITVIGQSVKGREIEEAVTTVGEKVGRQVKVEGAGEVEVEEKPTEVVSEVKGGAKYDVTEVDILVALPVIEFPVETSDLNEIVERVKKLGVNFNVVTVSGLKGTVKMKMAETGGEVELRKDTVAGVWQIKGLGRDILWGLQVALNDAIKRVYPERDMYVEDISAEMVVFRDMDEGKLYIAGWKTDDAGRVVLSPVVKEVVVTYLQPDRAREEYEAIKLMLWRPDLASEVSRIGV